MREEAFERLQEVEERFLDIVEELCGVTDDRIADEEIKEYFRGYPEPVPKRIISLRGELERFWSEQWK